MNRRGARPRGIGPALVRGAALAALVLAVTLAPPAAAADRAPWEFPDHAATSRAERAFGRTWYENYFEALTMLRDRSTDVEGIVGRLRLAIHRKPDSSANEYYARERTSFVYAPYYHLAVALARAGRVDDALACAARERELGVVAADDTLSDELTELDARLRIADRIDAVGDAARRAAERIGAPGTAPRQAIGETSWARVDAATTKLAGLTGSSGDAKEIDAAADALTATLRDALDAGLSSCRSRLTALAAEAWAPAFGAGGGAPTPSGCESPSKGTTADGLAAAVDRLADCSARALAATRAAGEWGCTRIRARRTELAQTNESWRAWAAAHGADADATTTVPPQPDACGTAWSQAGWSTATSALDAMGFVDLDVRLRQGVEATRRRMAQRPAAEPTPLARTEPAAPTAPGAAAAPLAAVDDGCRAALGLGALELPSAVTGRFDESAVRALLPDLERGVGRLTAERGACPGIDSAALDDLDGALSEFRLTGRVGDLARICNLAPPAAGAVDRCWQRNVDVLRDRLRRTRALVAEMARPSGPAGAAPACLDAAAGDLDRGRPGRDTMDWVRGSRSALEQADACLDGALTARRESFEARVQRVAAAGESLSTADAGADDALARRVAAASRGVADWLARADEVADAADAASGSDGIEALERRVETERAAAGLLDDEAPAESGWIELADALEAYDLVGRGLALLRGGDVDGAVLLLRRAGVDGGAPATGRPGALCHATLAYALWLESRAAAGDEVARSLADDAADEACLARRADPAFRPDTDLFPHPGYAALYARCDGVATTRRR